MIDDVIEFTGAVKIDAYLPYIDVIVFTSVSEAQPLVILEAGAAGIPVIATRVGACEEMIMGTGYEDPPLGAGGSVVPLSNPTVVANEAIRLLSDNIWREECSLICVLAYTHIILRHNSKVRMARYIKNICNISRHLRQSKRETAWQALI